MAEISMAVERNGNPETIGRAVPGWIDGPVRVVHGHDGYGQFSRWIKFGMGGATKIVLDPAGMELPMEMEPPEYTKFHGGG